jgi:restriction system protein
VGRRRKKESLIEALNVLPWWVGVGLGVFGFAACRWIFPSMLPPVFKGFAAFMPLLGWIALGMFGVPGLISLVRTSLKPPHTASSAKQPGTVRSSTSRAAPRSTPAVNASPPIPETNEVRSGQSIELPPSEASAIESWSLDALRKLEWKRFELLSAKYYEAVGFKSETLRCGPDGGIDVKLFKDDPAKPIAVVQCKAWNSASVGVKEVRERLGVMAHEKVARGIFVTTASYTKDALEFGKTNPIQLLDGEAFVRKIQELSNERQNALLRFAFEGDYATPTCASCGIKMVRREGKQGAFWGCTNYPKCRSRFHIKNSKLAEAA